MVLPAVACGVNHNSLFLACMIILDGRKLARIVNSTTAQRVEALRRRGVFPKLGILLVGDFAPSLVYVRNKVRACAAVGIEVETVHLGATSAVEQLVTTIQRWNQDARIHGMIVQLPLPVSLPVREIIDQIAPLKDVDGLTSDNLGRLLAAEPRFVPATPAGIVELLCYHGIEISGAHVVIVGRGGLVGKPLANLLLLRGARADATVTVCHTRSRNLTELCQQADILIAAAGQPGMIRGDMVREGAVVVDAGTSRGDSGITGDVEFESVAPKVRAITPVPGGVGPMTVAMLLRNLITAAEMHTTDAQ